MNSETWVPWLVKLALLLLAGVFAGSLFNAPALGLAVVLAAILAQQLLALGRLLRWLHGPQNADPPDLSGPWGELVSSYVRLNRRRSFHKRRLLRLLRELRRSTAAMPDGVVVLNPQAEILWFNRTAGRLLGLRAKGDVGLRIDNLVRQPEFVRYLRGDDYGRPVTVRSAVGVEQYLSIQLVPYGAGQLLALVRDVTSEARLGAMRRDFVANASHELRSPLTVISGYLETLAQEPDIDPTLAAPLQEMRRQSQRMTGIVSDLLELSGLESSDREAPALPMNVGEMMEGLRLEVLARPAHPASVTTEVDSQQRLLGDEGQIHSAFSNLVDNAAKYTPPEGAVQMRWWTDEQGGHFLVSDSGIGIASEHIPRLTERFYRVDPGRSRATGGSGLGLAIVKHVLQRHGATLAIESEEGKGSRFYCHFPRERLQPPE